MNIEMIPLIIPLIAGIAISVLMIFWLLIKKFIACYKIGAVLFFGFFIWMTFYSLELLSTELSFKILMSKIEYFGITIVPVTFFLLVLHFSGYTNWTQIKKNFFLLIIPLITVGLVFTNGEAQSYMERNYFTNLYNNLAIIYFCLLNMG